MSYLSPEEQEQVLVLTTKKPMSRWLQVLLKILAVLLAVALVIAAVIGWRYYSVHQRLKKDLTEVIRTEEHLRALGGINAAADLIIPSASDSWRFRYLSSIRARKGRPEPKVQVQSVGYDGVNARVKVLVDGVRQFRHYQLYTGKDWRRAPFIAKGWGNKKTIEDAGGFKVIYWDEDEAFAQALAADLPDLVQLMRGAGLTPASSDLAIVPGEFGELARPAQEMDGIVLNSPHVDLIPETPGGLSAQQMLRLSLAGEIVGEARKQVLVTSDLPGAARLQNAIDDVLAWHWAAGEIPAVTLAAWRDEMKGHWVSPATGLPPDLITQLPPDAPDAAARLMMAWLLRKEGPDALFALSASLPDAKTWDEAYDQAVGKTAAQVEQAAAAMAQQPGAALPEWPQPSAGDAPQKVTLLTTSPDASGRLMARTLAGDVVLLQPEPDAAFVMADGSTLQYGCVAPGSQVQVQGRWMDAGLRLTYRSITLDQAVLPPVLRTPPLDSNAEALAWRYRQDDKGSRPQLALVQLSPGAITKDIAYPYPGAAPYPPTLSRSGRSPLLFWQQNLHCNRNWILAYDPDQGIIDSWLAPEDAPGLVAADVISGEEDAFLLEFRQDKKSLFFQGRDHHVLQPLSPQEGKALRTTTLPHWRPVIDLDSGTLQVVDRATGERRTLYAPAAHEELLSVIPAWGAPDDSIIFTVRRGQGDAAITRVLRALPELPDEAVKLFDAPSSDVITGLTSCHDGSYLYGVVDGGDSLGALRLHTSDDDNFVAYSASGDVLTPVLCVRPPQSAEKR